MKGAIFMGRKNSEAWNSIHALCNTQELDEKQIYEKAKLLLGIYRRVCWSTIGRAEAVNEDVCYYYGNDLDGALIYLETFAPEKEKQRFEARIRTLFETRWMMELVEQAMVRVKEFPDNGDQYYDILVNFYLSRLKYTESDMLDILNMERSRYYDRKKEAIMVFGIALWGTSIPKMREFLKSSREEWNEMQEFDPGEVLSDYSPIKIRRKSDESPTGVLLKVRPS